MQVTIGLAQTKHPEDGDVIALVERFAAEAHSRGVDMLVFPESLMSRYEKEAEAFVREAESVDGAFATALDKVAARYGLWMVYTLNERNPKGNPFNTAIIVDSTGTKRGIYRKIHLFDTDFTHESDRMSAGSALFEPIDTPFGKIGLAICYPRGSARGVRHPYLSSRLGLGQYQGRAMAYAACGARDRE